VACARRSVVATFCSRRTISTSNCISGEPPAATVGGGQRCWRSARLRSSCARSQYTGGSRHAGPSCAASASASATGARQVKSRHT
jgi:hypothetical protein